MLVSKLAKSSERETAPVAGFGPSIQPDISHTNRSGANIAPRATFAQTFDAFLDRMPAWIFHVAGVLAALIALWFTLAYLGGLPIGVVEWIALALVGAFAYALGFMVPLALAFVVEGFTRSSLVLAVVACGAALSIVVFPVVA